MPWTVACNAINCGFTSLATAMHAWRLPHRFLHRVFPHLLEPKQLPEKNLVTRRGFFSSVSAAGACIARPAWLRAREEGLRVNASPTVFFSHPDGAKSLVRFEVTGVDAMAGRLRVFDRSRRLLGTAGVLRSGDTLLGELWMEFSGAVRVVSELEAPGLRGPFRTNHRLEPQPRWTIHLLTVADPIKVVDSLQGLRPIHRAVQTAVHRSSTVTVNPLPMSADISSLEHVPFLRLAERALIAEREYAIPMGPAAYAPQGVHLPRTVAMSLAGAGVRVLAIVRDVDQPFEWWDTPGGSRVLVVSVPAGSTPGVLGFELSQTEMTNRVEHWLSSTALRFAPDGRFGTAVIVNPNADQGLSNALAAVSDWNSRFAYPRIVATTDDALFREMETRAPSTAVTVPTAINQPQLPRQARFTQIAEARVDQVEQRTGNLIAVLAGAVDPGATTLGEIAPYLSTDVPGTMVFNPSPFSHSDLAGTGGGGQRFASNVPGLGYAFFPDETATGEAWGRWETMAASNSAEGRAFRVTIAADTGAISSLKRLSDGKEWVRPQSAGLNALPESRLENVTALRLPGVATKVVLERSSRGLGDVKTTIVLFDGQPWLNITNETEVIRSAEIQYRFDLAIQEPRLSWEIPAGVNEGSPPVSLLEHLRWIRLDDRDGTILFRGHDAPLASIDERGTLMSYAPSGVSRYRLAPMSRYAGEEVPWMFGWDAEGMATARVEPNGTNLLPRFGSMLTVEEVGVCVLGIQPAANGYGAIAYLQEILGVSRNVSVGPGILEFRTVEAVDYLERYKEDIPVRRSGTADVPMPANGIVAVRLAGLELT